MLFKPVPLVDSAIEVQISGVLLLGETLQDKRCIKTKSDEKVSVTGRMYLKIWEGGMGEGRGLNQHFFESLLHMG